MSRNMKNEFLEVENIDIQPNINFLYGVVPELWSFFKAKTAAILPIIFDFLL